MDASKRYIKVNLPLDKESFERGNGEGVFVIVDDETKKMYDENASGGRHSGVLDNDSVYYPSLRCGTVIYFEFRGENRPVALLSFLENYTRLTDAELEELKRKIARQSRERCFD